MNRFAMIALCLAFLLMGCGRKGDLEPPPGTMPDNEREEPVKP